MIFGTVSYFLVDDKLSYLPIICPTRNSELDGRRHLGRAMQSKGSSPSHGQFESVQAPRYELLREYTNDPKST
jgi:hypothetical protein